MEGEPTPGGTGNLPEKEQKEKDPQLETKKTMMQELRDLFALREKGEEEVRKALSEKAYLAKAFTKDAAETSDLIEVIMDKESYPSFADFEAAVSSDEPKEELKKLMEFALRPFEAKGGEV